MELLSDAEALLLKESFERNYAAESRYERFGTGLEPAARGDYRALLAVLEDDPQSVWTALFDAGLAVEEGPLERALAPLPLEAARRCGMVTPEGAAGWGLESDPEGRAVFSDQRHGISGARGREHVLGIGGASRLLRDATLTSPVDSALDIGTGSGVQAFHLASAARSVCATDLSERALAFARLNAVVNGLEAEFLRGDLLEPVAGRTFDRVVANPPFVIATPGDGWTYRDGGREGDGIAAELAAAAPQLLNPGGTLQFLANWLHVEGEDWRDRVASWIPEEDVTAWIVQRDAVAPLDYVRTWQRDAGDEDPRRAAAWLDWFDEHRVEAVGFGFVNLKLTPGRSAVRADSVAQAVEAPWSARVAEVLARLEAPLEPEDLWGAALRVADGVRLRQEAEVGESGWEVGRQWIEQTRGLRLAEELDPLLVEFLASCDGTVPVGGIVGVFAEAYESESGLLYASMFPVLKHLVERGFLVGP
ncbi:methyltransferase [Salininema proteolyticum]|uniref:Methyltransferase n=1 Tax=Salininema proteolyticum TaxID=1607685 RepID=A0ABV8U177_9ACTN